MAAYFSYIVTLQSSKDNSKNANIDNQEQLHVLVSYKNCLVHKFRECVKSAAEIKHALKDQLVKELSIRFVDTVNTDSVDSTNSQLIYDLCGYLIHTRSSVLSCEHCKKIFGYR